MSNGSSTPLPMYEFATLRPRFKQRQVETNNVYQNWQIRVHRALSWLKRSEELPESQAEAKFILLWIALNSLYSRWDRLRNAPAQDSASRHDFLETICRMDPDLVERMLRRYRPLIKKLLEEPYLSNTFWRNPDDPKAKGRAAADANYLEHHLKNREHCTLLGQTMDRLYVLRGQLVHGASTGGGKLNRKPLSYCLQLLTQTVPLIIHIILEHGANDEWPELCYPPSR